MITEKRNLTFISDPGHGWLSVSLKDLKELNLVAEISSYSYMNLTRAYLEEDSDYGKFLTAAKAKGWEIKIKESHVESTPIRGFASYTQENLEFALNFKEGTQINLYNSSKGQWSTKAEVTGVEGSKVYIQCEFGNKYKVSKDKFLSRIKPLESLEETSIAKPRM